MRNEGQKPQGSGRNNGFLRSFSSYLRIVSNGASTVASTVKSAGVSVASTIADRDEDATRDQVLWAGFDKLEGEAGILRQVLLLGYRSGFQVWDVEDADDVRQLVSRHDGPVSFLQMLKKPVTLKRSEDTFVDVRPLLVVAGDAALSGSSNNADTTHPGHGNTGIYHEFGNENSLPTFVHFYSLRTHDYVHFLKFRTTVLSVRCSPRIVAIAQASQIHCFNSGTLEREYTILTCAASLGNTVSGSVGYGPVAVGPRWLAYSGNPVMVSNSSRVSAQHLTSANGLSHSPANGSFVAHYAKESSKQLAVGIVTLGDIGYKKFTKYYSEFIADNNGSIKNGNASFKVNGTINGHVPDSDNVGMVIVRDIVLKSVIVQFRAHRSPIAALCFDPSGTLLVTASINGHNINVFRIMPSPHGGSSESDASGTCIHLYRLQRGLTNAVIQDISFSDDSKWIMISSSRGTSHLFSISPFEGASNLQVSDVGLTNSSYVPELTSKSGSKSTVPSRLNNQGFYPSGSPVTLSVVGRIKNGNGWKGAVTGAAAAATGRVSPLSGAIASVFHNCKRSGLYSELSSLRTKYHLLVFSPTGSVVQYFLRQSAGEDSGIDLSGLSAVSNGGSPDTDSYRVLEPLQKWDICHNRNRRDRTDYVDVYGEHATGENSKLLQKGQKKGTSIYPSDGVTDARVKHSSEENHHMYISEVELHMHSTQAPLWSKPEIYFQAMIGENIITDDDRVVGGEIEIERIPSRTVEARSKELIAVFDHLQSSRFRQSRMNDFDHNRDIVQRQPGVSDDRKLFRRNSSDSIDRMSESSLMTEYSNGINGNCLGTFHGSSETKESFVNNTNDNQDLKKELEFVNNRAGLKMEAHLECVDSKESLKMGNHFLDHDDNVN